jgi:hypothetical protein
MHEVGPQQPGVDDNLTRMLARSDVDALPSDLRSAG